MFDLINTGRWWDKGIKLVEGCTRVSPACDNCWALSMDKRFGKADCVTYHPERLQGPIKRKKPTVYAIWNDLFHEDVPFSFVDKVFAMMALCPQHIFIVLTKRPERMEYYFGWVDRNNYVTKKRVEYYMVELGKKGPFEAALPLPNVWLGVTAENQEQADKRIPILLRTPAAKRIVSIEPMLGEIDLQLGRADRKVHLLKEAASFPGVEHTGKYKSRLDWVICGGETGSKARPMHPDWARSLRDQCVEAGVPFYFKAWGEWAEYDETKPFSDTHLIHPDGQYVDVDGATSEFWDNPQSVIIGRVGKKEAGRILEGRTWNEIPEVK